MPTFLPTAVKTLFESCERRVKEAQSDQRKGEQGEWWKKDEKKVNFDSSTTGKKSKTHEHRDGLLTSRLLAVVGVLGLSNLVVKALGNGDGEVVIHLVKPLNHGLLHLTTVAVSELERERLGHVSLFDLGERVVEELSLRVVVGELGRALLGPDALDLVRREGHRLGVDLGVLGGDGVARSVVLPLAVRDLASVGRLEAVGVVVRSSLDPVLRLAVASGRDEGADSSVDGKRREVGSAESRD